MIKYAKRQQSQEIHEDKYKRTTSRFLSEVTQLKVGLVCSQDKKSQLKGARNNAAQNYVYVVSTSDYTCSENIRIVQLPYFKHVLLLK